MQSFKYEFVNIKSGFAKVKIRLANCLLKPCHFRCIKLTNEFNVSKHFAFNGGPLFFLFTAENSIFFVKGYKQ